MLSLELGHPQMNQALARETILVVDDEPQVLVALEDLLSDEFLVLKSESAERALKLVAEDPNIAVVVSDQRMPKMKGDELFQRLRAEFGAERILSTGFADLTAVIRAVNDGQIFAYVTKPWDPEDLRVKIQRAADHFRLTRELARERQLLEDLMRSVPDAIFFKDRDLRFERVNEASLSMVSALTQESVLGRSLSQVWPANAASAETERIEREIMTSKRTVRDSISSFTVNGEMRWYSTTKAPILDRSGEAVGLVGISRDVTSRFEMEEALRMREEQLRLTFLASSAGLFDWDLQQGTIQHSPSLAAMIAGGAFRGKDLSERVHPDDAQRLQQAIEQHLRDRTPLRALELRARVEHEDEYHWFEVSAQGVWNADNVATRLVGSFTDISERKRQEARIRSLTRTHAILSGINSMILRVHDREALLREACDIAVRVGELSLAIAVQPRLGPEGHVVAYAGTRPSLIEMVGDWLLAESRQVGDVIERSAHTPIVVNELGTENVPGSLHSSLLEAGYQALAAVPVIVAGQVDCWLALFADRAGFFDVDQTNVLAELGDNIGFALEHSAQKQRLDFLAYYDELTGLANRALLEERLTKQLATCGEAQSSLSVVLIDVERFRHVNDTLGRRAGDRVLTEIAQRLISAAGTAAVARYSSNTFAVCVSSPDVSEWVTRTLAALGQSANIAGTELRLSARAGVARYPSDGNDSDSLLAKAEAALKRAKESSQRWLVYTPDMNQSVAERLSLETRLRNAIEQQEFLLHYQPKVAMKTGKVVGFEALIRWMGPDGKLIPPGLFIPLLEETGMIVEVGKWVMESAAMQFADWTRRGLSPPRIAVNVSPLQLGQPDFVRVLESVLKQYPQSSAGLDLEITESVLMADLGGNVEKLRQAREAGLSVSIDDFGTGYSSLGYISRLPIDALKIDRSFVTRMADDPQEMAIVTTIISLAHALDLKVIAEGVETTQQAHLLRLLQCDQAQGYLLAKPLGAADAEPLLAKVFDLSRRVA